MKFKVTTSGYFYPEETRRKKLEKIGFIFKPSDYKKFKISGDPIIEIKDLNELIKFTNKFGEIIISDGIIEIYDDYRE